MKEELNHENQNSVGNPSPGGNNLAEGGGDNAVHGMGGKTDGSESHQNEDGEKGGENTLGRRVAVETEAEKIKESFGSEAALDFILGKKTYKEKTSNEEIVSAVNGALGGVTRIVMSDGRTMTQMSADDYLTWLRINAGIGKNGEVIINKTSIQQLDDSWTF